VTSVGTNRNLDALLAEHAQVGFAPDDVSNIIKESIDSVLQNQQYSEQKVSLRCQASASSTAAGRFAVLYQSVIVSLSDIQTSLSADAGACMCELAIITPAAVHVDASMLTSASQDCQPSTAHTTRQQCSHTQPYLCRVRNSFFSA
jgi:hypothetical protein